MRDVGGEALVSTVYVRKSLPCACTTTFNVSAKGCCRLTSSIVTFGQPSFQGNSKPDRVICVPAVEDRLIQRVALAYLTAGDKLSIKNAVSYGFHRGKDTGVREAIRTARNIRVQHRWVLKSDIQSFFDEIDRSALKKDLVRTLKQRSVLPFLLSAIDTEIRPSDNADRARLSRTSITVGRGLRQGMPLSPLLSNFVLREFDRGVIRANFNMVRLRMILRSSVIQRTNANVPSSLSLNC